MKSFILVLALLQSAPDLFKAANADFDAGRWADAAAKYELVLKEDPTHIPSQFNLAVSYSKEGNASGAIAAYRKLLEQDGKLYEARTNLAILLDQNGMRSDAAEQYEKALALRPDDPQTHFNIGMFYIRGHEIEKAYPHLTTAADKGLNIPELYVALSEAAHERKDEARSRAYLEKASELDPANKNIRRQLGIIYREAGEFGKAIEVLRPLLPESRVELSFSYFDNKNYAEAAALLEEVVKASPENADYLYMLGRSYMELKLYPQVIVAMAQAVRIKPDYVEAYETVASVFFIQEDWNRAAQVLTRVVELKPTQAINHFVLATCLDKLGNVPDALLHYNKFLEYDDGSSDARSFQARQRARILEERLKRK
jgi:tetratricopeptide (TPR) repeat protein